MTTAKVVLIIFAVFAAPMVLALLYGVAVYAVRLPRQFFESVRESLQAWRNRRRAMAEFKD